MKTVNGPRRADAPHAGDVARLTCACATVRRASRAVTQLYDSWLRRHGIEGPQFALLAMLDRLGECNQTTMGRHFDLDKTTLSRNLKLLSRKGWIAIGNGADARERRVTLTPAGRRRLAAARPGWRQAQERLRSSMRPGEWSAMWQTLNRLTRAAHLARRGDDRKASAQS
jgi:DNA-binding MarR family transcriptional regulator